MFTKLHDRHEGEPPRRETRVAPRRKQRGKVLVLENGAQLIAQCEIGIAFGKGGMRNLGGLLRDRRNGLRVQRHDGILLEVERKQDPYECPYYAIAHVPRVCLTF